jgi:hypothetical protein
MAQDSGFGKNNNVNTPGNDVQDTEVSSAPLSHVRDTATSGTYSLSIVQDTVAATLGPDEVLLSKFFREDPKSQILWQTLCDIHADTQLIIGRLDATTRVGYFFDLLIDYLSTVYIALGVRSGNQENVHVFQHKNDIRMAAEAFAETKDAETALRLRTIIRNAVNRSAK